MLPCAAPNRSESSQATENVQTILCIGITEQPINWRILLASTAGKLAAIATVSAADSWQSPKQVSFGGKFRRAERAQHHMCARFGQASKVRDEQHHYRDRRLNSSPRHAAHCLVPGIGIERFRTVVVARWSTGHPNHRFPNGPVNEIGAKIERSTVSENSRPAGGS